MTESDPPTPSASGGLRPSHLYARVLENENAILGGGENLLWLKPSFEAWTLSPEIRGYQILKATMLGACTFERWWVMKALGRAWSCCHREGS